MDIAPIDRVRKKFSRYTYFTFVLFVILAVAQWSIITFVKTTREIFRKFELFCSFTFAVSCILFGLFIFIKAVRSHKIVSWLIAVVIVELQIFSMFVLAARTWLPDMLGYFLICLIIVVVALIIGCNLSYTMDMTEYVAPIFITSYILVASSMYALMAHLNMVELMPYAYLVFDVVLTVVMFSLLMLHAQTIKGDRFIQMSTADYLLAALLIFHEFLAIYALTFYWQIHYNIFTMDYIFWWSTSSPGTTDLTTDDVHLDDIQENPDQLSIAKTTDADNEFDDYDFNSVNERDSQK